MRPLLLILALLLSACVAPEDDEIVTDEAELPDDDGGKEDAASELYVRAGETSLWVDKAFVRATRDGASGLVMNGRTSRNLTDGMGFVFDDVYGAWRQNSARTFDLWWTDSELASLIIGVNQFVRLQFVHSSSRPDSLTARVVARARMTSFSGTGSYLFTDVVPVVSGGRTVLRVRGSATENILEVRAEIGPDLIESKITDARHFAIDLPLDRAIPFLHSGADLEVSVRTATGNRIKRGKMVLVVKKLGLTTGDAYDVWPAQTCEDEVRACLASSPSDACGEAIEVNACGGDTAAVTVTAELADAAIAAAEPQLTQLRTDGTALVGADRSDALVTGARRVLDERIGDLVGTVYPSAADRDAAVTAAAAAAINDAYAFPLQHVPALTPAPDDPVRAAHAAADALLTYMITFDMEHTEYGRPYVEMVRLYRAVHLESLASFRTAVPEDIQGWPPYLFVSRYLGSHTEISVDATTGVVTNVYFEID